jgi:hypothetical protein
MVEFTEPAMRHYCRNPRCRSKLPAPVSNSREAFCTRGCHSGFYRKRCRVCEQSMERKTEHQLVCGRRKCCNGLQARSDLGHGSRSVINPIRNPINTGIKSRPADDRGVDWAIALNRAHIIAPRRVLDAVFGRLAIKSPPASAQATGPVG